MIAQTIEEGKQSRAEGRDQSDAAGVDMAAAAPEEPQASATLEGEDSEVAPADVKRAPRTKLAAADEAAPEAKPEA